MKIIFLLLALWPSASYATANRLAAYNFDDPVTPLRDVTGNGNTAVATGTAFYLTTPAGVGQGSTSAYNSQIGNYISVPATVFANLAHKGAVSVTTYIGYYPQNGSAYQFFINGNGGFNIGLQWAGQMHLVGSMDALSPADIPRGRKYHMILSWGVPTSKHYKLKMAEINNDGVPTNYVTQIEGDIASDWNMVVTSFTLGIFVAANSYFGGPYDALEIWDDEPTGAGMPLRGQYKCLKMGDSICYGQGTPNYSTSTLLYPILNNLGLPFTFIGTVDTGEAGLVCPFNKAHAGWKMADVAGVEVAELATSFPDPSPRDILYLHCGLNDTGVTGVGTTTLTQFRTDTDTVINQALAANPNMNIIILSIIHCGLTGSEIIPSYNAVLFAAVQAARNAGHKVFYLDQYTGVAPALHDNIHPSNPGFDVLARFEAPLIYQILEPEKFGCLYNYGY